MKVYVLFNTGDTYEDPETYVGVYSSPEKARADVASHTIVWDGLEGYQKNRRGHKLLEYRIEEEEI